MAYNPNIHHRRSIRLKGYDYSSEGMYFITICVQNRKCIFGKIENGKMMLNDYGKIVFNEWLKTPLIRCNITLGEFVVMPNHFHAIFIITQNLRKGEMLSPNICKGKLHSPNKQGEFNSPLRGPSHAVGAIVRGFKSAVSKQLGFSVWQRNYYEHIIRDEQAHQNISEYIVNNPAKWDDDKFYFQG